MDRYEHFGKKLRELRNSYNMSLKEFAQKVFVSTSALSAYESGTRNPSIEALLNISKYCEVSIDWLYGLSDFKNLNRKTRTYKDLFSLLLRLSESTELLFCDNPSIENEDDLICGTPSIGIAFDDSRLTFFLIEWRKMKKLHAKKTIDDELYKLWIEKVLKQYEDTVAYRAIWGANNEEEFIVILKELNSTKEEDNDTPTDEDDVCIIDPTDEED